MGRGWLLERGDGRLLIHALDAFIAALPAWDRGRM